MESGSGRLALRSDSTSSPALTQLGGDPPIASLPRGSSTRALQCTPETSSGRENSPVPQKSCQHGATGYCSLQCYRQYESRSSSAPVKSLQPEAPRAVYATRASQTRRTQRALREICDQPSRQVGSSINPSAENFPQSRSTCLGRSATVGNSSELVAVILDLPYPAESAISTAQSSLEAAPLQQTW